MGKILTYCSFEFKLQGRLFSEIMGSVLFFMGLVFFIPFSSDSDPLFQDKIKISLILSSFFLVQIFSFPMIFQDDLREGFLDFLALSKEISLESVILVKSIIHMCLMGLSNLGLALFLLFIQGIPFLFLIQFGGIFLLLGALISLMGIFMGALTLRARTSLALFAVLIFPFFVPSLILGGCAFQKIILGISIQGEALALLGILMIYIPLSVFGGAFALRESLSS